MSLKPILLAGILISTASAYGADCTRDSVKGVVGAYFKALEARDPSLLATASNVRFTENGRELKLGEGLWKGAGKLLFQRNLIDPGRCGSLTQAVVEENGSPILMAVRLNVENGKIAEVETIVARSGDFAFKPLGVVETADQHWESILPPEQRSSREAMNAAVNAYFDMFAENPTNNAPFAYPCERWENGTKMMKGYCSPKGLVLTHTHRRFPVTDVEAGIAAGFVHFNQALPDVHMYKMRNGKIELIQAICGPLGASTGWPDETGK